LAPKVEEIQEPLSAVLEDDSCHLKAAAVRAYSSQKKQLIENQLISDLLPMVPKIVQRVLTYLKPPLSFDDLVSAGTLGLVKAARDYDPSHQAEFKTYAYIRIRGAVLDELRGWSFVSANLTKQISKVKAAAQKIAEETGSTPTDEQLAQTLGITTEELYKTYENARAQAFLSIDVQNENTNVLKNLLASENTASPDHQIEQAELIMELAKAIEQLPKKQKQVIILYYQQNLTMKQVAEVFNVTESRVSQLHAGALFNLSVKLRHLKDGK